jgi:predicted ATP-grasp superfamily ATP-dependent carboligase
VTEFDGLPVLRSPVVVAAFEGWNDAADAASAAVEHLQLAWQARPVDQLDPERYYDFQSARPMVSMTGDEGGEREIEWPTTRFYVCELPDADRDVVLLRGIEPNIRWKSFCDDVLEICHSLEAEQLVLLGALLADVPYARPLPVTGSATHPKWLDRLGLAPTRYEGPTGVVGVLHEAAERAELDVVSFWVHVPHYASQPPCPKATLALLHRVEEVLDLPVPTGDLPVDAADWEDQVRELVESDSEIAEYVRSLEQREAEAGLEPLSGDEIAKEFEKYLRRRGGGPSPR